MQPDITKIISAGTQDLIVRADLEAAVGAQASDVALTVAINTAISIVEGLDSETRRFWRPHSLEAVKVLGRNEWPDDDDPLRLLGDRQATTPQLHTTYIDSNGNAQNVIPVGTVSTVLGLPQVTLSSPRPDADRVRLSVIYGVGTTDGAPEDVKGLVAALASTLWENPGFMANARVAVSPIFARMLHRHRLEEPAVLG